MTVSTPQIGRFLTLSENRPSNVDAVAVRRRAVLEVLREPSTMLTKQMEARLQQVAEQSRVEEEDLQRYLRGLQSELLAKLTAV